MNLAKIIFPQLPTVHDRMAPVEACEAIGEVEVEKWFGATRLRVSIGEWGKARLQVWGQGRSISEAATDALGRLCEAGIINGKDDA